MSNESAVSMNWRSEINSYCHTFVFWAVRQNLWPREFLMWSAIILTHSSRDSSSGALNSKGRSFPLSTIVNLFGLSLSVIISHWYRSKLRLPFNSPLLNHFSCLFSTITYLYCQPMNICGLCFFNLPSFLAILCCDSNYITCPCCVFPLSRAVGALPGLNWDIASLLCRGFSCY